MCEKKQTVICFREKADCREYVIWRYNPSDFSLNSGDYSHLLEVTFLHVSAAVQRFSMRSF